MDSGQDVRGRVKWRRQHRQRLSKSLRQNLQFRDQQVGGISQQGAASEDTWCLRSQPPAGMKLWQELEDFREKTGPSEMPCEEDDLKR